TLPLVAAGEAVSGEFAEQRGEGRTNSIRAKTEGGMTAIVFVQNVEQRNFLRRPHGTHPPSAISEAYPLRWARVLVSGSTRAAGRHLDHCFPRGRGQFGTGYPLDDVIQLARLHRVDEN